MESVKRIEVIVGAREIKRVEEIFEHFDIHGYMIHSHVLGKGNRWVASPNALTGEFEDQLVTTTCSLERLTGFSRVSRPL
jgi:hypothetical protein